MTQNTNTTSPSDNSEQPPQAIQVEKPAKLAKTKPQKNLYEPYRIPMILWRLIRGVVRLIVAIILDVHLVGCQNVPETGPLIIASNHLSWADIPLIPAFLKRKVVYMAKEETFQGKMGWLVRFLGASKIHKLGKAHSGMGMIALRSGAPVLPVAIYGSEKAFKKFRPRIIITFGEPMILKPKGKKITREDIDQSTEQVMLRIASMLPPEYRGVYAEKLPAPEAVKEI